MNKFVPLFVAFTPQMRKYLLRTTCLFCLLLVLGGCVGAIRKSIKMTMLPPTNLKKTTLLVQKFEYQDPIVYDPYYAPGIDTLKAAQIFKQVGKIEVPEGQEGAEEGPRIKEHPLIRETNLNLDKWNTQVERIMHDRYYAPSKLVTIEELNSQEYEDRDMYRYILRRKPVLHCYVDPNKNTQISYKYLYFFEDRKTGKKLPEIQLYSEKPVKTTRAIFDRLEDVFPGK